MYVQDLQTESVNCRVNVCRLVNHGRVNVPEKQNLTSCKACVECVVTITGIEPQILVIGFAFSKAGDKISHIKRIVDSDFSMSEG